MSRKIYKPEDILAKLREVDSLTAQGRPEVDAIRAIGVTDATYYRWCREYGGLSGAAVFHGRQRRVNPNAPPLELPEETTKRSHRIRQTRRGRAADRLDYGTRRQKYLFQ